MKYFTNCKTKEEAKAEYRKLAKKMHPDAGGSKEAMVELQAQHEAYQEPPKEHSKQNMRGNGNTYQYSYGSSNSRESNFDFMGGQASSIYDEFRKQNAGNPYFRSMGGNIYGGSSYTFYPDDDGELTRLRSENMRLEKEVAQLKSQTKNMVNNHTLTSNQNHILETENKALRAHSRALTKEVDELRRHNSELLSTYPKTSWQAFKHQFKLILKWIYDDQPNTN